MGQCISKENDPSKLKGASTQQSKSKYSKEELDFLQMLYDNLAVRCKDGVLSREVFEIFFHTSGLLGEVMFSKFDPQKTGTVTFQSLRNGLELMVKGTFEQKADVLFEFYDIDKTGAITYDELLKMLLSYPTKDLKEMLTKDKFVDQIGQNHLHYYFGPEWRQQEKDVKEKSQESDQQAFPTRKSSAYQPSSTEFIQIQQKMIDAYKSKVPHHTPAILKKPSERQDYNPHLQQRQMSIPELDVRRNRKGLELKSNVSSLTKKYASFLFAELNQDKKKGRFSKEHFYKLLKTHPAIFNVYFSGFHTYIWLADDEEFGFMKISSWIESQCEEEYMDKSTTVFLKFIKSTIFVFPYDKARYPKKIISLEGLTVEGICKGSRYGMVFKHRDGLYPEVEYYFLKKQIQEEWLKHLNQFKDVSLFAVYTLLEKIGSGNFSMVYKGKDKATGKLMAIKVIENFKLSVNEREVIQRECGILKLCHHPNIIKFMGEYKTKTHLYIVMELLSEGDLFEYTKKHTFLEEYQAAVIFKQLVDAISYLNELGIIHRDLKPENVMIITTQDHRICKKIKLIDFGFGVYKDKLKDLPEKLKFAGTPGFIAPEVLCGKEYDEKVDTFSLGIILYFMLSGFFPFHSNYYEQIAELTKSCTISLSNAHWSNVSENAKDLIYKVLTLKDERISTKEVKDHPWLQGIETLKQYEGRNKKNRYI